MSVSGHIRSNLVGYVALFVALTGTAWAVGPLAGKNTVTSAAIVNGQVRRADVATNAITSAKVADGALRSTDFAAGTLLQGPRGPEGPRGPQGPPGPAGTGGNGGSAGPAGGDLAGTYPNPSIRANAVGAAEVIDQSLTGADVNEATLGQVPSAVLGGLGRRSASAGCDPESGAFVPCATVSLSLPERTHVLVMGATRPYIEDGDATVGIGTCRLGTTATGGLGGTETGFNVHHTPPNFPGGATDHGTLLGVTPLVGPGAVGFSIECNQSPSRGAIRYLDAAIVAVAISPS